MDKRNQKSHWSFYFFSILLTICTLALLIQYGMKGDDATKLEEQMFGLILAVVTGGVSYSLGLRQQREREQDEEREKLRPFVRSALRRAAGISNGLSRLDEADQKSVV